MKYFDYLSPNVQLYFDKQKRHGTTYGFILTIFIIAIGIGSTVYFSLDLFLKNTPKSFVVSKFIEDPGFSHLSPNELFHMIGVGNPYTRVPIVYDKRMYRIWGQNIHGIWEYDKCDFSYDLGEFQSLFDPFATSFGVCVRKFTDRKTGLTIIKNSSEVNMTYPYFAHVANVDPSKNLIPYNIYATECVNTTENNNFCYPREKIIETLNGQYYGINFVDNNIDISNYDSPISKVTFTQGGLISFQTPILNNLNFKPATIKTHDGWVFDTYNSIETTKFIYNEKLIIQNTNTNPLIFGFGFYFQNTQDLYERFYIKLQEVLANIGGMVNAIIYISKILLLVVDKHKTMNDMNSFLDAENTRQINRRTNKEIPSMLVNNSVINSTFLELKSKFTDQSNKNIEKNIEKELKNHQINEFPEFKKPINKNNSISIISGIKIKENLSFENKFQPNNSKQNIIETKNVIKNEVNIHSGIKSNFNKKTFKTTKIPNDDSSNISSISITQNLPSLSKFFFSLFFKCNKHSNWKDLEKIRYNLLSEENIYMLHLNYIRIKKRFTKFEETNFTKEEVNLDDILNMKPE